jgi:hypothetical protein
MKIWLPIILFAGGLVLLAVPVFSQEIVKTGENVLEVKAFFSTAAKVDRDLKKGDYNQSIADYRQFLEKYPRSSYSALSYLLIAGIYRDDLRDYSQAGTTYGRVLTQPGEDKLTQISRQFAARWRQRIKLVLIKQALRRYYAHEVEYPASLNNLLLKGYLKENYLRDLKENSYFYRPKASSLFPTLKGQEYVLYSSALGKGALPFSLLIEEKKAFYRQFSLQGLMRGPQGRKAVINYNPVTSSAKPVREILAEGAKIGGAQVLVITDEGVILSGKETILVLTMGR